MFTSLRWGQRQTPSASFHLLAIWAGLYFRTLNLFTSPGVFILSKLTLQHIMGLGLLSGVACPAPGRVHAGSVFRRSTSGPIQHWQRAWGASSPQWTWVGLWGHMSDDRLALLRGRLGRLRAYASVFQRTMPVEQHEKSLWSSCCWDKKVWGLEKHRWTDICSG